MALASLYGTDGALGEFVEKDEGQIFEYVAAADPVFGHEYPHKIMVGYNGEYRYGNVKKTVAHIVVDEAADGSPVVEKWYFKRHVMYKW
jgi:hypothetical protein